MAVVERRRRTVSSLVVGGGEGAHTLDRGIGSEGLGRSVGGSS